MSSFMLLLDVTIVNIALSDIERDLGATLSDLQWVIAGYAVAISTFLLWSGAIADAWGRRRVFLVGLLVFVSASLICGFAQTSVVLILARILQGVGAAALLATGLALLSSHYRGRSERAIAFGVWGAASGAALAVGPLAGGALVEVVGWRSIFLVNIPVGAILIALVQLCLDESRDEFRSSVNWISAFLLATGIGALSLALLRAKDVGWASGPTYAALAVSVLALILFLWHERVVTDPLIPRGVLTDRDTLGAAVAIFATSATAFALLLYITLYLQTILQYDALQSGLRLLPLTAAIFAASATTAALRRWVTLRWLAAAGLVLIAAGLWSMSRTTPGDAWTSLLLGEISMGLGVGLVNPSVVSVAMSATTPALSGVASGINNTFRSLGIAVGIALLGTLFSSQVEGAVSERLEQTPLADRADVLGASVADGQIGAAMSGLPDAIRPVYGAAARDGFVSGLTLILVVAAGAALVGAVLGLVLMRGRGRSAQDTVVDDPPHVDRESRPAAHGTHPASPINRTT